MTMSRVYADYINKIALTIPDQFIDVRTGAARSVSLKVQEQIEYHTNNGTLVDFLFSALHHYLKPKNGSGMNEEILCELLEIKRMLERGHVPLNRAPVSAPPTVSKEVDLKEVEDVLDAFGG